MVGILWVLVVALPDNVVLGLCCVAFWSWYFACFLCSGGLVVLDCVGLLLCVVGFGGW